MNLQPGSTIKAERSGAHHKQEITPRGRWLLVARVSWIALTLFLLALNAVMIPRYYAVLLGNCRSGPQCFALQLTNFDRQFLHQSGLTRGFLAAYQVMLDTTAVLLCCSLGALLFWRRSADRMALFCAFMLVLFGGAGFTSILRDALAPLSTAWFVLVNIFDPIGQSSFMIFFLLFPSGRFVPRIHLQRAPADQVGRLWSLHRTPWLCTVSHCGTGLSLSSTAPI